jgi:N-acetylmuramic acid 6-phosphate etherase
MIDVVGANAKLRERAAGIVADIAGCPLDTARLALADCAGNARAAIAHLVLGLSPADAAAHVQRHADLRAALRRD